ncbi:phosphodiester glycosidase family protein [Fontivita pretiosa]|uniref:phosphodiester glycosidase family protein n=1 Tax=Fontivita pretiosa TaxID=2989684 RepID=UPI003D183F8E
MNNQVHANGRRARDRQARCFRCGLVLLIGLLVWAASVPAEVASTRPYEQVTYVHERRRDPDMSLYVVTIDLADPDVKVRVAPGGADPDGPDGPWQTTLLPTSQIARRERFDVAINASFFAIRKPTTAPGAATQPANPGYRPGVWAQTVGWAMTDGRLWGSAPPKDGWPIVWVEEDRRVKIGLSSRVPKGARQIATGNCYVVKAGKPAEPFVGMMKVRHPRTVIGTTRDGSKLILLVVDGRRPGVSVGMTGAELADEMLRLGCWDAINLDGGGSATLVIRDPQSDELKIMNQPSDGRERAVANVIGISVGSPPGAAP